MKNAKHQLRYHFAVVIFPSSTSLMPNFRDLIINTTFWNGWFVKKEQEVFFGCQFPWNLQLIDSGGRGFEEKVSKLLKRSCFNQLDLQPVNAAAIFPPNLIEWVDFTQRFI